MNTACYTDTDVYEMCVTFDNVILRFWFQVESTTRAAIIVMGKTIFLLLHYSSWYNYLLDINGCFPVTTTVCLCWHRSGAYIASEK